MSSFIGHSLTGLFAYSWSKQPASNPAKLLWLLWLVIIAVFPDIDYAFPFLRIPSNSEQTARITHSIAISLLLPLLTIIFLAGLHYWRKSISTKTFITRSIQVIFTGLSHITLDFLVGVMPLPLLYPLSTHLFKFDFGILPSAGRISLTNYFFYRNIFIELGILLPFFSSIYLITHQRIKTKSAKVKVACLLLVSTCFLFWSTSLSR